jgi:CO dehydrogenase maturation factor
MTKTFALAGKGGTGKTTIAALLIRSLLKHSHGPILAIDADPSANLHLALGLQMPTTVGEIREGMAEPAMAGTLGVTISRQEYLSHELFMALEEGEQVDLLAMGRPEGQGCYCAVNHLLRDHLDGLESNYAYVVIDNEAGMEHISRRTTRGVDHLLIASDPTLRGLRAAAAIKELASEVDVEVREMSLVLNRVQGPMPQPLQEAFEETGLEISAQVPADDLVNEYDALGTPLASLDGSSPAVREIEKLAQRLIEQP